VDYICDGGIILKNCVFVWLFGGWVFIGSVNGVLDNSYPLLICILGKRKVSLWKMEGGLLLWNFSYVYSSFFLLIFDDCYPMVIHSLLDIMVCLGGVMDIIL